VICAVLRCPIGEVLIPEPEKVQQPGADQAAAAGLPGGSRNAAMADPCHRSEQEARHQRRVANLRELPGLGSVFHVCPGSPGRRVHWLPAPATRPQPVLQTWLGVPLAHPSQTRLARVHPAAKPSPEQTRPSTGHGAQAPPKRWHTASRTADADPGPGARSPVAPVDHRTERPTPGPTGRTSAGAAAESPTRRPHFPCSPPRLPPAPLHPARQARGCCLRESTATVSARKLRPAHRKPRPMTGALHIPNQDGSRRPAEECHEFETDLDDIAVRQRRSPSSIKIDMSSATRPYTTRSPRWPPVSLTTSCPHRHGLLRVQQRRGRRRHAQAALGARRVALVDSDAHHGNGTQAVFYDELVAKIVKEDPEWLAAMARRGVDDVRLVCVCPLSAGSAPRA
jgi:hypothetical protein